MEPNRLVAFTLHHGTVLERSEWLFLASGNAVEAIEAVHFLHFLSH